MFSAFEKCVNLVNTSFVCEELHCVLNIVETRAVWWFKCSIVQIVEFERKAAVCTEGGDTEEGGANGDEEQHIDLFSFEPIVRLNINYDCLMTFAYLWSAGFSL